MKRPSMDCQASWKKQPRERVHALRYMSGLLRIWVNASTLCVAAPRLYSNMDVARECLAAMA